EDGIRDFHVTGVQTCALPILDILWMQAATAHRVHAFNRMYYRRYGIDDELAARANDVIVRSLAGGNFLTRKEVSEALAREGIERSEERRVGQERTPRGRRGVE